MTGSSSRPIRPVRRASSAGQACRMLSASARSSVVGAAPVTGSSGGNTGALKLNDRSTPNARLLHGSTSRASSFRSAIRGVTDLQQTALQEAVAERGKIALDHFRRLFELADQQRDRLADPPDAIQRLEHPPGDRVEPVVGAGL